jgi:hypothetical protein
MPAKKKVSKAQPSLPNVPPPEIGTGKKTLPESPVLQPMPPKTGADLFIVDNGDDNWKVEDIVHYGKVVVSLRETIRLMGEVDGVIESAGGWPVK